MHGDRADLRACVPSRIVHDRLVSGDGPGDESIRRCAAIVIVQTDVLVGGTVDRADNASEPAGTSAALQAYVASATRKCSLTGVQPDAALDLE